MKFLSLRSGPTDDAETVAAPAPGIESPTDVWAEYQVGPDETTFVLVAAQGIPAEEWAVTALTKE